MRRACAAVLAATCLFAAAPAAAHPFQKVLSRLVGQRGSRGDGNPAAATSCTTQPMPWREVVRQLREELQLYRGRRLERASDWLALGPGKTLHRDTVDESLKRFVREQNLPHRIERIGDRDVLVLQVKLGHGSASSKVLRELYRRVGDRTVEYSNKFSPRLRYPHSALRVGLEATYDLAGKPADVTVPSLVRWVLRALRGDDTLYLVRRRNMRRVLEKTPPGSTSGYVGYLLEVSPTELRELAGTFERRARRVTGFAVSGGDGSKGEYSCAQFLTEDIPLFQRWGITGHPWSTQAAQQVASAPRLRAIVEYVSDTTEGSLTVN
ncbi:MAG: hypothetical protein IT371_30985 [Deltaproteobacteria bacterium]|nr:hypothetical protein [Deltaproteobacteria bacterium]